jgi:hypothetical protein
MKSKAKILWSNVIRTIPSGADDWREDQLRIVLTNDSRILVEKSLGKDSLGKDSWRCLEDEELYLIEIAYQECIIKQAENLVRGPKTKSNNKETVQILADEISKGFSEALNKAF